jgi:hypothetical protein
MKACEDELELQLGISKECQADKGELGSKNQRCEPQKDELDTKSEICQREREDLETKNKTCLRELDELDTKSKTCQREKDDLDTKSKTCQREKDDLDTRNKTCQREKDELDANWKEKYERDVIGESLFIPRPLSETYSITGAPLLKGSHYASKSADHYRDGLTNDEKKAIPDKYWRAGHIIASTTPQHTKLWDICANACQKDPTCKISYSFYGSGHCYKVNHHIGTLTRKDLGDGQGGWFKIFVK